MFLERINELQVENNLHLKSIMKRHEQINVNIAFTTKKDLDLLKKYH